jgi:hypothetical protein
MTTKTITIKPNQVGPKRIISTGELIETYTVFLESGEEIWVPVYASTREKIEEELEECHKAFALAYKSQEAFGWIIEVEGTDLFGALVTGVPIR